MEQTGNPICPISNAPWRFSSLLIKEHRLRLICASVVGSWKSIRSATTGWGILIDALSPHSYHFPVREEWLSVFVSCFDNPASGVKYLQYLRKACELTGTEFIPDNVLRTIKTSVSKLKRPSARSFIMYQDMKHIIHKLVDTGKHELARFIVVAYTYQLRVQSEIMDLRLSNRDGQCVYVEDEKTTISLPKRKNIADRCYIVRTCYCKFTPIACGACSLRYQMSLSKPDELVFPNIRLADIKIIQKCAAELNISRPTWHGFRRGRTCDLLSGVAQGPVSIIEIFDAGGWQRGSRALLSYLSSEGKMSEGIIRTVSQESDSD